MENTVVKVKNLEKKYPDLELGPLDFEIKKGLITGLIGENGAGKTTLIKLLLNLANKDQGEITFWNSNLEDQKERVGIVFDEIKYPDILKISELSQNMSMIYSNWDDEKFKTYIKEFNLPETKKIRELSKGMKIKLQLAVCLSHDPDLLLLDEITSGLDPIFRDDLLEILLDYVQDPNHTIFCSTHNLTDIEKIADRLIFLHQGKILFDEDRNDLLEELCIIKVPISKLDELDKEDILAIRKGSYSAEVLSKDPLTLRRKYRDFLIENASLDEIMLLFLKGDNHD